MGEWWRTLSDRERLLVGAGGLIAGLLLVFQLIFQPVNAWRTDKMASAATAQQSYALVAQAAAEGGAMESRQARAAQGMRTALTQSASSAGIELIRVGAETGGRIDVQPAPTDPAVLFNWLASLEQTYGVHVAFADISRGDDGAVNAQILSFEQAN